MGKFNSHFSDYYTLRTIIEHLDQIVEIMEKKYGIEETYLKYVDKGLREKFLTQQERLTKAIKRGDDKNIIPLARGMIKAFKIVDGICEDQKVKKIDSNVWQIKHDGLPKTIINVSIEVLKILWFFVLVKWIASANIRKPDKILFDLKKPDGRA